jgi:hypothetical protein
MDKKREREDSPERKDASTKKQFKGPPKILHLDGQASGKKILIRSTSATDFFCFRCNVGKKAKLQATWATSQGEKIICNGCYGLLLSKSKK